MAKHGERDGGVSAVWTTTEVDGGPLVAQRPVVLGGTETSGRVRELHFQASWQLLDDVLPMLIARCCSLTAQDRERRSYFGRPAERDYLLDWAEPTDALLQTIRAGLPAPGALAVSDTGRALRVLHAHLEPAPARCPSCNRRRSGAPTAGARSCGPGTAGSGSTPSGSAPRLPLRRCRLLTFPLSRPRSASTNPPIRRRSKDQRVRMKP